MTLDKAIEILTIHNDHNPNFADADRREAYRLGIEALKREKENRDNPDFVRVGQLPGETND
ncbi:hypothetical protein KKH23_09630 [Patescibacteria group bacterium]|nr:hypothetical protein [Patescibacteria group bacterium]